MAKKASADIVSADMAPPNWRGAVQIIRHVITKKKEKIQGITSEIGDQWGKVEGYKVNKKAGQIFAALDKLEHPERMDIMRSLNGLIDAAGWDEESEDLVDAAEGKVVHMRFGKSSAEEGADEGNGNGEDPEIADVAAAIEADQTKSDDAEKVTEAANVRKGKFKGLDAARSHLGNADQQEPYTGDNSDLANEDED